MLRTLLLAIALAAPASAAANDWIVSTLGSDDGGKGTVAKPFRTVRHVLERIAKEGDTVMLRGIPGNNVYAECDLRVRVKLTLRSYPGELAHIRCAPGIKDSVVLQLDREASGSTVADLELSGSEYYGVKLNTEWYRGGGEKERGVSHVLLENLRIHDTGRDGIKITPKADHITIRRSEIWNTGAVYPPGTPQDDKNADGIDNVGGSNMVVEDNYIHDIATTGLYFKGGARDVLVQRNRIENAAAGIRVGFDTSPEFFDIDENPRYYEAIGGVVRNNYIRNTIYAGIALHGAKDATVTNNTIVDAARKGQAALFFGLTLQDGDKEAGRPASVNPKIERNLVSQKGGNCVEIRWMITEIESKLAVISALEGSPGTDYNTYYSAGGRCRFVDDRNGRGLLPAMSLDTWRKSESSDLHSIEAPFAIDESTGRLMHAEGASAGRGVIEPPNR